MHTIRNQACAVSLLLALFVVVDGDTVRLGEERIRLVNIDAPEEHRAGCDAERRLGRLAKERLRNLLASGRAEIARGDRGRTQDRYGRTLARVKVDGVDVGETLISEGYARPWTGRRSSWCAAL
jgi:micrococcal nuclease